METKDYLILITNDCFDVARALYAMGGYKVYYNATKRRYEIFSTNRLELVVPYDNLDARTIEYVRKTAKQNADILFEEMEKQNADIERQKSAERQKIKERIGEKLNEIGKRRV